MTTDELRRMLELAARAQGIRGNIVDLWSGGPIRLGFNWFHDDGDSARMRTALRMNVIWSDTAVHCLNSMGGSLESFSDHNGDRNAALRLCALKVAAMIGEGME